MTQLEILNQVLELVGNIAQANPAILPTIDFDKLFEKTVRKDMFYQGGRIINATERPDMMAVQVRVEHPNGRRMEHLVQRDELEAVLSERRQELEKRIFQEERMRGEQERRLRMAAVDPPRLLERDNRFGISPAMQAMMRESQRQIKDSFDEAIMRGLGFPFNAIVESKFPEYSDEKFEGMGKAPLVKEIMPGMVKLTEQQRLERIKLYLEG